MAVAISSAVPAVLGAAVAEVLVLAGAVHKAVALVGMVDKGVEDFGDVEGVEGAKDVEAVLWVVVVDSNLVRLVLLARDTVVEALTVLVVETVLLNLLVLHFLGTAVEARKVRSTELSDSVELQSCRLFFEKGLHYRKEACSQAVGILKLTC